MVHRSGLHHLQKRKKSQQYPHKNKWINRLDKSVLAIAIIEPFLAFPQVMKIFLEKNASGVSIYSRSLLAMIAIPWLVYGIAHKDKPIIASSLLWFLMDVSVVFGTVLYG